MSFKRGTTEGKELISMSLLDNIVSNGKSNEKPINSKTIVVAVSIKKIKK